MNQTSKKVFINPKFNDFVKSNNISHSKASMHINPLFAYPSHSLSQNPISPKPSLRPPISRIHVNPNFMATKSNQNLHAYPNKDTFSDTQIRPIAINPAFRPNKVEKNVAAPPITATRYTLVRNMNTKPNKDIPVNKITANIISEKTTNTVKINKYKSVKIEHLKNNIDSVGNKGTIYKSREFQFGKNAKSNISANSVKPFQHIETRKKAIKPKKSRYSIVRFNKYAAPQIDYKCDKSASTPMNKNIKLQYNLSSIKRKYNLKNISYKNLTPEQKHFYKVHNRFRIVKQAAVNNSSSKNNSFCSPRFGSFSSPKTRRLSLILKKNQKINCLTNVNKFNKNNIPCPLFRKYGKCIRNINGSCKFLHDKKHVAICRKFLKGICHDSECLFSHDITCKKMPTCYHYLRGVCTKDNCPYLHVKLNENAKVCTDFARGFCEKGENCLNRHINICPNFAITGKCSSKRCPFPHKSSKVQNSTEVVQNTSGNKTRKLITIHLKDRESHEMEELKDITTCENNRENANEQTADTRYYKEAKLGTTVIEEYESIKPTRVKLGTLPSFIQL